MRLALTGYTVGEAAAAGEAVGEAPVRLGRAPIVALRTAAPLVVVAGPASPKLKYEIALDAPLEAPIAIGTRVGVIEAVTEDGAVVASAPVETSADAPRAGLVQRALTGLSLTLSGGE